jgi:hypothetical protein
MSFAINWCDPEHSILHVVSEGLSTWDEYHEKYDAALEVVRAADHRIDVIMEARKGMPPGNPLPHLQKIIAKWDGVPPLGLIVVIGARRMEHFTESAVDIAGMLTGVAVPEFVLFVGSVEDALATIGEDRIDKHGLPTLEAQKRVVK